MTAIQSCFMFTSGDKVYDEYNKLYNKHTKGYIILGPPGIGKTYYCDNIQKCDIKGKKEWIDADRICGDLCVKWHLNETNNIEQRLNYLRAEYILEQSRALGYRIICALFWEDITPDAIVIPKLSIHKKYMDKRKNLNLNFIKKIRNLLRKMGKKKKVKIFETINEAVKYLEKKEYLKI